MAWKTAITTANSHLNSHRATQTQLDFQLLSPVCDYAEQTIEKKIKKFNIKKIKKKNKKTNQ